MSVESALIDRLDDFEDIGKDFVLGPLYIDGLDLVAVLGDYWPCLLLEGGQPLLDRALFLGSLVLNDRYKL